MRRSTARKPKASKKVASETKGKKEAPVPEASAAVDAPRFPLFYKAPRPLEAAEHANSSMIEDKESGVLAEGGDRQLFDDNGKPTEITDHALEFCRAHHAQYEATR